MKDRDPNIVSAVSKVVVNKLEERALRDHKPAYIRIIFIKVYYSAK